MLKLLLSLLALATSLAHAGGEAATVELRTPTRVGSGLVLQAKGRTWVLSASHVVVSAGEATIRPDAVGAAGTHTVHYDEPVNDLVLLEGAGLDSSAAIHFDCAEHCRLREMPGDAGAFSGVSAWRAGVPYRATTTQMGRDVGDVTLSAPGDLISPYFRNALMVPHFIEPGMSGGAYLADGQLKGLLVRYHLDIVPSSLVTPVEEIETFLDRALGLAPRDMAPSQWRLASTGSVELEIDSPSFGRIVSRSVCARDGRAGGELGSAGGELGNGGGELGNGGSPVISQTPRRFQLWFASELTPDPFESCRSDLVVEDHRLIYVEDESGVLLQPNLGFFFGPNRRNLRRAYVDNAGTRDALYRLIGRVFDDGANWRAVHYTMEPAEKTTVRLRPKRTVRKRALTITPSPATLTLEFEPDQLRIEVSNHFSSATINGVSLDRLDSLESRQIRFASRDGAHRVMLLLQQDMPFVDRVIAETPGSLYEFTRQ